MPTHSASWPGKEKRGRGRSCRRPSSGRTSRERDAAVAREPALEALGKPREPEEVHGPRERRQARPSADAPRSSSQGWNVKTAGSPRSRSRSSAAARRARREDPKRPARRPAAARRPKTAAGQRRHLDERPAVAARCGAARAGSSALPSGGTRHHRGVARGIPPPRARRAPAAAGVADRPLGRPVGARRARRAASSIDRRAREQVVAELRRRHLVGAAVQVAVDADLVAPARRLADEVRVAPRDPAEEEDRRAVAAAARARRRARPSVVSIRGAKRVPAPRVGVVAVAADVEPVLRVDRQDARRAARRCGGA